MNLYLIDATSSLKPDWAEYVKAPEAPKNYKDPEKIQAYVEAKRANLEKEIAANTRLVDFRRIKIGCYDPEHKSYMTIWNRLLFDVINNSDRTFVIGNQGKTILNRIACDKEIFCDIFGESSIDKRMDFFFRSNYIGVKYLSFEEFIFNSKEREYLLTEKIVPVKREDYPDEVAYMCAALESFGFESKSFSSALYCVDMK